MSETVQAELERLREEEKRVMNDIVVASHEAYEARVRVRNLDSRLNYDFHTLTSTREKIAAHEAVISHEKIRAMREKP